MRICRFADEDLHMKKWATKKHHRIILHCCCRTIYIYDLRIHKFEDKKKYEMINADM